MQFNVGQEILKAKHNGVTVIREQIRFERQGRRGPVPFLGIVKAEGDLPQLACRCPSTHAHINLLIRVKAMSNLFPDAPWNDGNGTASVDNCSRWFCPTITGFKGNERDNTSVTNQNTTLKIVQINLGLVRQLDDETGGGSRRSRRHRVPCPLRQFSAEPLGKLLPNLC